MHRKLRRDSVGDVREAMRERPLAFDLFAGVGGMSLGLEKAGFDVAVAVELDELTGRYAQFNLPATCVLYGANSGDVRRISADVLRKAQPDRAQSEVALIAGGPPCQGFSLAGRMDTRDRLNGLVARFAAVVLDVHPLAFCLENVPGIARGNTATLARAIRKLRASYHVTDVETLWAHDFGVPQARERVFVIGVRRDLNVLPLLPTPTHAGTRTFPRASTVVTVADAIADIPEGNASDPNAWEMPYMTPPKSLFAKRMREIVFDDFDYGIRVAWDIDMCKNVAATRHSRRVARRFARLLPGSADPISGVHRLKLEEVSTTIRAGTTADRGSRSAPRPVHPLKPRVLTTRECARLQTFPDSFEFHRTRWHGNLQVGNAVPPELARHVGRQILSLLGLRPKLQAELAPIERDRNLLICD